MHHPLADLMEFDEENLETHLRAHHKLLLRGHLHRPDSLRKETNAGSYIEIAAGALHERHDSLNRFGIVDISDDLGQISVKFFTWLGNQWQLDRNRFPASVDGIGRISLRDKKSSGSTSSARTPSDQLRLAEIESVEAVDVISNDPSSEQRERAVDLLRSFPRFRDEARPEDMAVRQDLQEKALLAAETQRVVEIQAEWGVNSRSFVAAFIRRWRDTHPELTTLHARCAGLTTGLQLQDVLSLSAGTSLPHFASALRICGPCVIVLDDIAAPPTAGEPGSIGDTLSAILDFCQNVVFVATMSPRTLTDRDKDNVVCLGPLDSADTREYMAAHSRLSVRLESVVDYDRVRRATGGLPTHIDTVIEALAYTDLNGALSELDAASLGPSADLPGIVVDAVSIVASPHFAKIPAQSVGAEQHRERQSAWKTYRKP